MGNYVCEKCGEEASSKCAIQRNVFPEDQYATALGNLVRIKAVRKGSVDERFRRECDSDRWTVTYTIEADYIKAQDEDEAIKEANLPGYIANLPKESIERAFCDHEWRIKPGCECNFGCCKG